MMEEQKISISVVKRLPRYYRFLEELRNNGINRISSKELSARMGLTASQIRQDFNCFGGFGQQGYGYNVEKLCDEIGEILGLSARHKTILLGAGNLGRAVANHVFSESKGFSLIGIFDRKESLTGQLIKSIPIRHIDGLYDFCHENSPTVAIICLPPDATREICPQLIKLGISAIWNFSSYDVSLHCPGIPVENVHIGDSLMTICYKIKEHNKKGKDGE